LQRTGDCSSPPVVLQKLESRHLVKNLKVKWASTNSARIEWDYAGHSDETFHVNYTASKDYRDSSGLMKHVSFAGGDDDTNEHFYEFKTLRPYTTYLFSVYVHCELALHTTVIYAHLQTKTSSTGHRPYRS
jgi:hypothetical protein